MEFILRYGNVLIKLGFPAPEYDSTGSYQATKSALQSNDIRRLIDPSINSTHHYAFLTGEDGSGPVGIAYVGTPCLGILPGKRFTLITWEYSLA